MNPTCTGTQNLKYHEIIAQTYFCNRTTRNEFLIQSFGGRRGKLLFFRIFRRPSRSSNHFIFKTVFRHKKLHRESSSTTHIQNCIVLILFIFTTNSQPLVLITYTRVSKRNAKLGGTGFFQKSGNFASMILFLKIFREYKFIVIENENSQCLPNSDRLLVISFRHGMQINCVAFQYNADNIETTHTHQIACVSTHLYPVLNTVSYYRQFSLMKKKY